MIVNAAHKGYEVLLSLTEGEMQELNKWLQSKEDDEEYESDDPEYTVYRLMQGVVVR